MPKAPGASKPRSESATPPFPWLTVVANAPTSEAVQSKLHALGYSPFFEERFQKLQAQYADVPLIPARVTGQHRREWDVTGEDVETRAVLAGRRWASSEARLEEVQPTVGDWVALRQGSPTTPPVIEHILPRKTELARGSVARRGARQIIVANVDQIVVVAAFAAADSTEDAAARSLNPRRIERYLAAVQQGGARALVVLNKADLTESAEEEAEKLRARLIDIPVVCTRCDHPDGWAPLLPHLLPQETTGFVGLSGVGKSTIVNRILGREIQRTAPEREEDARGRHTTTHRELFITNSGFLLIDTPGMREFALSEADTTELSAFSDIAQQAKFCRFRNCRHQGEPGCAVELAVQKGELTLDRVQHYRDLTQELLAHETLTRQKKVPLSRTPSRTKRRR